ncbi:MAG: hypothetical protein ACTSYU_05900 [Promethearchaeota archaeon]
MTTHQIIFILTSISVTKKMVYDEEKQILNSVSEYLAKMGVPYKNQDIGGQTKDKFPVLICTYRYQGEYNFDVIIYNVGKWLHVKCLVLKSSSLKPENREKTYELALQLNYDLPEVTFSANKGDIYIEMDALVGISYDNFAGEFASISEGIGAFIQKIQKECSIQFTNTIGHEHEVKRWTNLFQELI